MGMLDIVARILGNQTALAVLKDATPWFRQFLDGIDDDNLAHMVNIEETGVVAYYLPLMAGGQQHGFRLRPLREIGKERYTVYFPIEKTKPV